MLSSPVVERVCSLAGVRREARIHDRVAAVPPPLHGLGIAEHLFTILSLLDLLMKIALQHITIICIKRKGHSAAMPKCIRKPKDRLHLDLQLTRQANTILLDCGWMPVFEMPLQKLFTLEQLLHISSQSARRPAYRNTHTR